jgi:GYF domain 2
MSDASYYAEGDKPVGPVSLADLIAILSRVSDAQSVFVWRDGLAGWKRAADIPELRAHLVSPPPLPIKGAIPEIEDKELKLTWLRIMRVWWACLWKFWIGALFFVLVLYLSQLIPRSEVSEKPIETLDKLIAGFFLFLIVSGILFSSVKHALQKHYSDFWIAIVPINPELTWFRTTRVSSTCLYHYWIGVGLLSFPFNLVNSVLFDTGTVIVRNLYWAFFGAIVLPMVVLGIALRRNYGDFRFALIPPKVDDSQRNHEWQKEQISDVVIASIFCALCVASIIWALYGFVTSNQIPWWVEFLGAFVVTLVAIGILAAFFRRR